MDRIEKICRKYGLCNCDESYTNRNLTAPDCPYHAFPIEEAMIEYATECIKSSLDKSSENANITTVNSIHKWQGVDKESITNPQNIILL